MDEVRIEAPDIKPIVALVMLPTTAFASKSESVEKVMYLYNEKI